MNTKSKYFKIPAVLLVAISSWLPHAVDAADVSWIATANNQNWTNTNNWSGGILPGSADNVFLANGFQAWPRLSNSSPIWSRAFDLCFSDACGDRSLGGPRKFRRPDC